MRRTIALIGVPSSAGARSLGPESAPECLRRAGLLNQLRAAGCEVHDGGDLPMVTFRPDHQHPRQQNLPLVLAVVRDVADSVDQVVRQHMWPLLVGGDCTIAIGALAGLGRHYPQLGMLYLDGDVDLNTPETTPSGIFDGMGLAHITGRGLSELTHLESRFPLLPEQNIALFGYCIGAGGVDSQEIDLLQRSAMRRYPAEDVKGRASQAAARALREMEDRVDHLLVHFDVDVIDFDDFPAADVPHRGGLSFAEAEDVLAMFLSSPKAAGLTVTEFNAKRDPDGVLAGRLVAALAGGLAGTAVRA